MDGRMDGGCGTNVRLSHFEFWVSASGEVPHVEAGDEGFF